jgi:Bacteriocin-protection, YdeI or OmpD-Associated/Domain of unknown function (DUF1905)
MPELRFDGRLESDQGAHFIRVPAAVLAALGREKRMPVKVTIKGYTYRGRIAVYGGQSYLGLRREVLDATGATTGEELNVGLEYDAELRTVDLPEAFRVALENDPRAAAGFDTLSYTHRKELVQWVTGARLAETQRARMEQAMTMLRKRQGRR